MRKTLMIGMALLLMLAMNVGCGNSNSRETQANDSPITTDAPSPNTQLPQIKADDIPKLPVISYANMGDNEWELKRLRLSVQGFEVLNERGRISRKDGKFSLSDASDSTRANVESNSEYLERTFWFGLGGLLDSGAVGSTLGFLEYYGFYYLVSDYGSDIGIVLLPLGLDTENRGTIPFDRFCEKAWEFFCYTENAPEPIYGGDGIDISNLP